MKGKRGALRAAAGTSEVGGTATKRPFAVPRQRLLLGPADLARRRIAFALKIGLDGLASVRVDLVRVVLVGKLELACGGAC